MRRATWKIGFFGSSICMGTLLTEGVLEAQPMVTQTSCASRASFFKSWSPSTSSRSCRFHDSPSSPAPVFAPPPLPTPIHLFLPFLGMRGRTPIPIQLLLLPLHPQHLTPGLVMPLRPLLRQGRQLLHAGAAPKASMTVKRASARLAAQATNNFTRWQTWPSGARPSRRA